MTAFWIFIFFIIAFLGVIVFFAIRSLFKKSTGNNKDYDLPDIDFSGIDDFPSH